MQCAVLVRQHPLVVQHEQSAVFVPQRATCRQRNGGVAENKLRSFILAPLLVHVHHLVNSLVDLAAREIFGVRVNDAHIQPGLACQAGQRQGVYLAFCLARQLRKVAKLPKQGIWVEVEYRGEGFLHQRQLRIFLGVI